jgi:hypothetical protein
MNTRKLSFLHSQLRQHLLLLLSPPPVPMLRKPGETNVGREREKV